MNYRNANKYRANGDEDYQGHAVSLGRKVVVRPPSGFSLPTKQKRSSGIKIARPPVNEPGFKLGVSSRMNGRKMPRITFG